MKSIVAALLLFSALLLRAQGARNTETRPGEKTTFQTAGPWKPVTDIRSDLVMVYGANDNRRMTFLQRVESWRRRGYTTHFMTGIAWGEYQDYFTGKWDGKWHLDEGQKTMHGDTIWHGRMVPYIVPTRNYLTYFKERHIKPVIDAGIDARLVHQPQRKTTSTLLECVLHYIKHTLALSFSQRTVFVSCHTCPGCAMTGQYCYIAWVIVINCSKKLRN